MSQLLGKTAAWLDVPQCVARGASPSEWPGGLVETPAALVAALQKLCHDWLCVGQGAEPRFFESESLLAAAPHVAKDATRQNALYKLTGWSKALNQHTKSAEHTLNASLMIEALLAEVSSAKQSLLAQCGRALDEMNDAQAASGLVRSLMFVEKFESELEDRL